MKIKNARVAIDYETNKWVIQGRKINHIWYDCYDDDFKQNTKLQFDLKYDACTYLQSISDIVEDDKVVKRAFSRTPKHSPVTAVTKTKEIEKRRAKNKAAQASRKRNRKK